METTTTESTFGSRLAAARRAAGLTQDQLGASLKVGKGAISSWEVNRTQPTATQLRAICERLNVSANDLLAVRPPWDGRDRRGSGR